MVEAVEAWIWDNVQAVSNSRPTASGEPPLGYDESRTRIFPYDLQGWVYGDRSQQLYAFERQQTAQYLHSVKNNFVGILDDKTIADVASKLREQLNSVPAVTVVLTRTDNSGAAWQKLTNTLSVEFSAYTEKSRVHQIVTHELRHCAQDVLRKTAARPPKSRSFGTSRRIQTPKWKQSEGSILSHILDDTEFQTNLADEVLELRQKLRGSLAARRALFRKWTDGPEALKFFRALRQHAPGKWRNAVSIAYAEIFGAEDEANPPRKRTNPRRGHRR
jgi:hypothetical protein